MANLPSKEDQFKIDGYNWGETRFNMINADLQGNPIRRLSEGNVKQRLIDLMLNAIQNCQNPKSKAETDLLVDKFYKALKSRYMTLKIEEVELAVNLGSVGEYNEPGDVVYVNLKNVTDWIRTYLNRKQKLVMKRKEVKEKQEQIEDHDEGKRKFIDYWERFPSMVRDEFLFYCANGKTSESVARIITGLERIGFKSNGKGFLSEIIPVETKQEWKEEIEKRLKPQPITKTITTYNAETKKDEHTKHTLEPQKIDAVLFGDEVIAECKRRAIIHWFESTVMVEMDVIKQLCDRAVKRALKRAVKKT
jgi:hypothetical protein